MRGFTFDFEGCELTVLEMASFAEIVREECQELFQHRVSYFLSCVIAPQTPPVCDAVEVQSRHIWRRGSLPPQAG